MIFTKLLGLILWICVVFGIDVELERIEEGLETDDYFDISTLRISRVRRGVYAFNGTIVVKFDLDNNILIEVKAFYSASGNSKFTLLPLKITPVSACEALNNHYKQYLMEELAKCSDFPYIKEDEYICPLKAGTYNVNMYEFDKDKLPQLHSGSYKISFYFNSTQEDKKALWNVYAKVSGY